MKRIVFLFAVVLVGWMCLTAGVREELKANPKLSANNYQAYPDKALPAIPTAPAGYEPFFINHYGRHGSRWLINEKKYTYPLQMLEIGERNGKLTPRGQQVLNILREVHAASKGRLGELSNIGHEQHQGIARRMFQNFPQVFKDGAPVVARSTVVIRCILSMQNEVDVLASLNPRLNISTGGQALACPDGTAARRVPEEVAQSQTHVETPVYRPEVCPRQCDGYAQDDALPDGGGGQYAEPSPV